MARHHLPRRVVPLVTAALVAAAMTAPGTARAVGTRASRPAGRVLIQNRISPLGSPVPTQWLATFNYYRDLATPNLPDVIENVGVPNDNYTYWDQWHATYMVETQSGINHQEVDTPATHQWYHLKG